MGYDESCAGLFLLPHQHRINILYSSSSSCKYKLWHDSLRPRSPCLCWQCWRGVHHHDHDEGRPALWWSGHLVTAGHLQVLLRHRCPLLPLRPAELLHEVRILVLRWLSGQFPKFQGSFCHHSVVLSFTHQSPCVYVPTHDIILQQLIHNHKCLYS